MEAPIPLKGAAFTYALLALTVDLIYAQTAMLATWFGRRCYERSRGEMIMMVYEKALSRKAVLGFEKNESNEDGSPGEDGAAADTNKPKGNAVWNLFKDWLWKRKIPDTKLKQPASTGKIFNVVRGDVYEIAQRFWDIDRLVQGPIGLVLSVTLIWKLLGPSCFLGVISLLVGQLLNFLLTRIIIKWRKVRKQAADARIQISSEYIEVLRHLRWYGWHGHWLSQVFEARQHELNVRIVLMILNTLYTVISLISTAVFPILAFWAYTYLAGNTLRVDVIFPALRLFNMLQSNLQEIPDLITSWLNAQVALGRINEFMSEPDMDINPASSEPSNLVIVDGTFAWPGSTSPVLRDVNLSIGSGITVIHGKVGAGKTALLQALLGELDQTSGTSSIPNEMIGYCSQTPWLQSMSIRDNILFFAPVDEDRYQSVLEACALKSDLKEFKHGDLSLIGENGVGLSGGQKARVALARSVYSRSRILFLDDPLSALDHNTAEFIVKKCFAGPLMEGRSIVLITHRLNLVLHIATNLVAVSDGTVAFSSTEFGSKSGSTTDVENSDTEIADSDDSSENKAVEESAPTKFMDDEQRSKGRIPLNVFWIYLKAGQLRWWVVMIIALALTRVFNIGRSWFFKVWGEAYDETTPRFNFLVQTGSMKYNNLNNLIEPTLAGNPFSYNPIDRLPPPMNDVRPWLLVLFLFSISQSLSTLLYRCFELVAIYRSGKKLFVQTMESITNATFRFYDVTPAGRLMNKLTSDMNTVDTAIQYFGPVLQYAITWFAAFVVIAGVTPAFFVFCVVLMAIFIGIFSVYLPTSQNLRRLETVSLSPLFANFGELLKGLTTVRAFQAQELFKDRIIQVVDNFQGMDHFYWSLQTWLMYRFQFLAALSTFLLTAIALYTNLSPGLTAFMLLNASSFVSMTHNLCRGYGWLQTEFVSVERVIGLLDTEQEPPGTIDPPATWPKLGGDVIFENVTIRYAEHLDPSLTDISLHIPGGSTTAIIGRTGSGKSTLVSSLLNIVRPDSGKIMIDNVNLADVNTTTLRHRVTFVAQDPVLFSGTIRHNLDPIKDHTDEECAAVLDRLCARQGWTLSTRVEAGGRNLSQGQRQLIGITRAVLRRSPVIILDEATASIDLETSVEIQQIIRDEMKESTVIAIAHRVEAVQDADYCVVLEKGRVLKQGSVRDMLAQGTI
jgi:ABC-type multidrug transport system fused ATPase/permease subunit